jgi:hypothetical protein
MIFTLGITTRYIDRHPTASMTNNPLVTNQSENSTSIKLRITDNCIKQSVQCKQSICPWTYECCFLPSGNITSMTLEVSVTPPD